MEIREIDNLEGLRAIEEPWCRLFDRAGGGAYDSPAFLLPWLEAAREDYALRVLTAWEGSELQALAPLVAKSAGKAGIAFRLVSFPAHGESPPFEILASSDRAPIVAAFLEHVTHRTPWHMLRLEHLAEDSPTVGALAEAATAAGLRFEESVSRRTFLVPVRTDWNTYLASRSRNLRRTLKRGRRSLEQHGTVDVRRYPDGDLTREQALEMALAAMEHSWKDIRRGRGPWSRLPLALAESLDRRGMLSLRFLRVDGEPVAYLYEIVHGRVVHAFHSAYDARFQEGSPGALLLEDAIRDAHERGRERYDFTGREPYMAAWADERAVSVEARVTPRSLHARIRGGLYLRIHAARRARARRETRRFRDAVKRTGRRRSEGPR